MDIKELKKIMEKERAKLIIVEDGEPIMIVSPFDSEQQHLSLGDSPLSRGERVDKKDRISDNKTEEKQKVIQSTEMISKEDLPSDELTVEDLPF